MIDLGGDLRKAREAKGISLAEAETATRIRARYLQALETNDWAALPTQVQAQGFLRNYAVYLGVDVDQVMSNLGQVVHSAMVHHPPPMAAESGVRTTGVDGTIFNPRDISIEDGEAGLPAWLSSEVTIGVVLALIVVIVVYVVLNLGGGGSSELAVQPTATIAVAPVLNDSTPHLTTGAGASPSDASSVPLTPTFDASIGSVQLSLEATEHVWLRVTVDGNIVLEGILAPGAPQAWQGTQQIVLETANGAGLKAVVNGQSSDSLGERGEPLVLAWGPSGPQMPAPTGAP